MAKTNRDYVWSEGRHPSFSLTLTVPIPKPALRISLSLEGCPEPTVLGFVPSLEEDQQETPELSLHGARQLSLLSSITCWPDFECQPGLEQLGPAGAAEAGWVGV